MALQNLINVAVTAADVIMLGNVSQNVLSGASLAGQIQYIMTLFFFGLTSGASVLTAQYWGKRDTQTVEKVLGIALKFSLSVAVIFTVTAGVFPTQCLTLFTDDPEVIREGAQYLRILCMSFIFTSVTMIYLNTMRSIERVVISTFVYLISLICNITLNSILIFGAFGISPMGIRGAAIGTCISRVLETTIVIIYSLGRNNPVHIRISYILKNDSLLFRDFLKFSLPVVLNEFAWGAGCATNSLILGHMGSSAVAANSVAQVTRQLSTVIAFGVANAAAIMIGKRIGSGDRQKAEEYGSRFVRLILITGAFAGALILCINGLIIKSVNLEPLANDYLRKMLIVMSYFVFAQSYNTTMVVGIFRGGGDTLFGLIMDISTMWGGSILCGAICAFVLELPVPVVYVVLMSDELIKMPITTLRYRQRKWLKNVTR